MTRCLPHIACTVVIFFCGATVGYGNEPSEDSFPYSAYVKKSHTAVRSGPGIPFYVTERLDWGTKVEVYRHVDDTWAAIRPPDGSFSWVRSRYLEPTDEKGVARVISSTAVTHVGTNLGDKHEAEYIELEPGELVEVLGTKRLEEPPGIEEEKWSKILPPAGEFRWIRLRDLGTEPPEAVEIVSTNAEPNESADELSHSDPKIALVSAAEQTEDPTVSDEWQTQPIASSDDSDLSSKVAVAGAEADASLIPPGLLETPSVGTRAATHDNLGAWTVKGSDTTSPPSHALNAKPVNNQPFLLAEAAGPSTFPSESPVSLLQRELISIHVMLSETVVATPENWQMTDMRKRTQAVIDASATAEVRRDASALLARIAQFEDIQRRHIALKNSPIESSAVARLREEAELSSALATILGQDASYPNANLVAERAKDAVASTTESGPKYDGTGWLMPVVSGREGVPRYALTDDSGNILHFVSPKPGLNLRRYERQKIGIYGQRGFVPEFRRPHLTAERIISLDKIQR